MQSTQVQWIWLVILVVFTKILVAAPLNNPHPVSATPLNHYYASFTERPRTLDPAKSYSSNEYLFLGQILEPPLQYDYLKRPYTLIPLTATSVPTPHYYDKNDQPLPEDVATAKVAYTLFDIEIQPNIFYQPHPAFAKDDDGGYSYHNLTPTEIESKKSLEDFSETGTRMLQAADYVNQIKRLAHPGIHSPIMGVMANYLWGFEDFIKVLAKDYNHLKNQGNEDGFLDLRQYSFPGARVISPTTYQIKIKGKYPQILYWMAMPFFAPTPWEAERFFAQADMEEHNLTLDWYPIGTGPYQLTENNPNRQMVLDKNPNFHGETYPTTGEPGDARYLKDAGLPLPFIDRFIFSLEKEGIPRWNKFLQGYYDRSGIGSDSFDEAISMDATGEPRLTEKMQAQGVTLTTTVQSTILYMGFNMLDPVVGGYSARAKALRQALSIAIDYEEYISIFNNGRGISAQGPIPPGIFGYETGQAGMNPEVYYWQNGMRVRKPLNEAKRLLIEAGYPGGRDAQTSKPLVLNYDTTSSGGPDDKARFNWLSKQFAKLGINLNIRATQYNRFQEKIHSGTEQLFNWGWNADYPDPENFLFLLYGPNGKVKFGGENAANYNNPEFNKLFEKMKNMDNGPPRQAIISEMLSLVRKDSPWIWGFHPKSYALSHAWLSPSKPHAVAQNVLKYARLDPAKRAKQWTVWNKPIWWPLWLLLSLLTLSFIPVVYHYWRREYRT